MTTQENAIRRGECCLGIELGSTRIKAVLIDETHAPAGHRAFTIGKTGWKTACGLIIWKTCGRGFRTRSPTCAQM